MEMASILLLLGLAAISSLVLSNTSSKMASIIKYTALQPLLTGPLLYILTRGSPELRARILEPLAKLPFSLESDGFIKGLKWAFALGLFTRVNGWLNQFARNCWSTGLSGGKAWDWPNEVMAVTGGSGGLGSVAISICAKTGMKVAIMDVAPPGENLKAFKNVHFYKCDITSPENVNEVAAKIKADLGPPSILFNNAGIGKTFNIVDMPADFLNKIFQVNLISHWYTTKAFLPDMIANKKGHVLSTASMASFINAAGMVDYCVTKAGVMAFHEGLTQELKHRYDAPFIRTSVIHPYWVKTALIADWTDKNLSSWKNNNVFSPLMTPEYVGGEIAKAILSGQSQQVILPPHMSLFASTRAFAYWVQEAIRDSTKALATTPSKA